MMPEFRRQHGKDRTNGWPCGYLDENYRAVRPAQLVPFLPGDHVRCVESFQSCFHRSILHTRGEVFYVRAMMLLKGGMHYVMFETEPQHGWFNAERFVKEDKDL